jgi:hypothetical protein
MSLMLYYRATGGVNVSCHSGCTRQEIEGHLTRLYPHRIPDEPAADRASALALSVWTNGGALP